MKEITDDYVSFEIAKLLKEKGFDISCKQAYFNGSLVDYTLYGFCDGELLDCPSQSLALKWLREVHHLQICVSSYSNRWEEYVHGWQFLIKKLTFTEGIGWNWDDSLDAITDKKMSDDITYITYEQAVEAAIKYTLENLI